MAESMEPTTQETPPLAPLFEKAKIEAIEELFTYHPPKTAQLPKYNQLRDAAKAFAYVVMQNTPPGADRTAAIRKLRECVMTANAAIALEGLDTKI